MIGWFLVLWPVLIILLGIRLLCESWSEFFKGIAFVAAALALGILMSLSFNIGISML